MPFDNLAVSIPTIMDEVQLIAVEPDRVNQWKLHVLNQFMKRGGRHEFAVISGRAKWRSSHQFLYRQYPKFMGFIKVTPPHDVLKLLGRIATTVPDAKYSLDFFDTDPILYLHDGNQQHCLAIWDGHIVRAIAGNATLSVTQRFFRHFVPIA